MSSATNRYSKHEEPECVSIAGAIPSAIERGTTELNAIKDTPSAEGVVADPR